jgi:hypothetical protein
MLFRLPGFVAAIVVFSLIEDALSLSLPSSFTQTSPELGGKRSDIENNGVKRTIFEHEATSATLDFVTNSGICETTPGVNQYSGYLNVGSK